MATQVPEIDMEIGAEVMAKQEVTGSEDELPPRKVQKISEVPFIGEINWAEDGKVEDGQEVVIEFCKSYGESSPCLVEEFADKVYYLRTASCLQRSWKISKRLEFVVAPRTREERHGHCSSEIGYIAGQLVSDVKRTMPFS